MFNIKVWFWSWGTFAAVSFVLCVIYGLVTPEVLHMHEFLEMVLPGFTWLSPTGFVIGLVESFLWGAYLGIVFVPIHNFFYKRWSLEAS